MGLKWRGSSNIMLERSTDAIKYAKVTEGGAANGYLGSSR